MHVSKKEHHPKEAVTLIIIIIKRNKERVQGLVRSRMS